MPSDRPEAPDGWEYCSAYNDVEIVPAIKGGWRQHGDGVRVLAGGGVKIAVYGGSGDPQFPTLPADVLAWALRLMGWTCTPPGAAP